MNRKEFGIRRRKLMQQIGDGVAVIPTAPQQPRNGDAYFPFRPDSDFYYLTHFPEPEAVALLLPNRDAGEFVLFCRSRDPEKETWDGRRAGLEGAKEHYDADQAYPIDELDKRLPGLLENRTQVLYPMGRYSEFDSRIVGWVNQVKEKIRSGVGAPAELADLGTILHEMRLRKRTEELKIIRKAAKIAAAGHIRAMQTCRPGMWEYQVQAELEYEFQKQGSGFPAYSSIVAGGANACILHYVENNARLIDGDLLLIDAGCELDNYASDITRTFPVNGRFSAEQKAIYEIVLTAQLAAIEQVAPGKSWSDFHDTATRVLTEGMIEVGLIGDSLDAALEQGSYKRFYMHRTGHWLGMDVHDVGQYKVNGKWRPLQPGMLLTVEPGLYITAADDIDPRWHNIGMRIEDDVLVTKDGHEILTRSAPKSIDEIEALMTT